MLPYKKHKAISGKIWPYVLLFPGQPGEWDYLIPSFAFTSGVIFSESLA